MFLITIIRVSRLWLFFLLKIVMPKHLKQECTNRLCSFHILPCVLMMPVKHKNYQDYIKKQNSRDKWALIIFRPFSLPEISRECKNISSLSKTKIQSLFSLFMSENGVFQHLWFKKKKTIQNFHQLIFIHLELFINAFKLQMMLLCTHHIYYSHEFTGTHIFTRLGIPQNYNEKWVLNWNIIYIDSLTVKLLILCLKYRLLCDHFMDLYLPTWKFEKQIAKKRCVNYVWWQRDLTLFHFSSNILLKLH